MKDYYAKLEKAIRAAKRGMAYLHVFSPCPTGWRFAPDLLIEIGRQAVLTNMVPLWEYSAAESGLRFTHPVDNPLPVPKLPPTRIFETRKDMLGFVEQLPR